MSTASAPSKACFACLAALALLGAAVPAAAKGAEALRSARSEALVHQGQALLDAGHVDAACAKFEASETLENSLGTLLHLGDCYERAGRSASAWHAFLEAEAVAHAKKDIEHEQVAAQRVSALEPKLTHVLFVVPQTSRVPGLTIQLGPNAIPASAWGTRIPVDAHPQRVTASARGYRSWEFALDASQGEGKQFRVNVPTLSPAPEPAGSSRRAAYRTAGVVTGSFGLAGLGAGAVFNALSHSDDAGTCARGLVQCTPDKSTTRTGYADAATVSFALGGALVATGVTLFVLAPGPDDKEKNALRVAARYASGGGRLQLEGVW